MRKVLYSFLWLALFASLTGCTSATKEKINKVTANKPVVSPILEQEDNLSLKRVVAIARFSDETKRGGLLLIDNEGERLGKQASDILAARLTETNKFIMLERADFQKLNNESESFGTELNKVGADFLILGSVSEFGRTNNSEVGIFSRNRIQTANVTVNVRLVNTKNGQIVYSEEASGEATSEANRVFGVGQRAGYDSSLDDKALSAAISKLVSNVVENLMDSPWQAYLVGQQGELFMMTGGKSQGVSIGDSFSVVKPGQKVVNRQTGMTIELPGEEIGEFQVDSFIGSGDSELSLGRLVEGAIDSHDIKELVIREKGKI